MVVSRRLAGIACRQDASLSCRKVPARSNCFDRYAVPPGLPGLSADSWLCCGFPRFIFCKLIEYGKP
ncbi:hypothetical protein [Ureibacillus terrenus]|uniref:Uncharacterized protein n=1 Tax=Ureibacillus terrenus TaxID=118246 RepID=A0A540V2B1_9BACL|nr:hypothetical protein [Ureibacillus terrenus]MED3764152.1 hypothetical protein [Ureibacillus terrenus]TQE90894.1 hypothetical protein FKZ59_07755 [Ureibacillus terrenus]